MLFITLLIASSIALLITFVLYVKQGLAPLSMEILNALLKILEFWFLLAINFAIPLALFINTKYLFNKPLNGFSLKLLTCPKEENSEIISKIAYGDLVQVYRKMFFLLIWNSAVFMLVAVVFFYLVFSYKSLFDWFSIYLLYLFILLAGYPSIILLMSRCKRVRIIKC